MTETINRAFAGQAPDNHKPNLIRDGDNFWRRIAQHHRKSVAYAKSTYEKVDLPKEFTVVLLESTARFEGFSKPVPDGIVIKQVTILPEGSEKIKEENPSQLTKKQFDALYHAVGAKYGWWPTDDKQWDSRSLFENNVNYVMYKDGFPVGFSSMDRNYQDDNPLKTVKLVYTGIIPQVQGKGYGSYFQDFRLAEAWKGGTERIVLDTVPEFDKMPGGVDTLQLHKRKGMVEVGRETVNVQDSLKDKTFSPNQLNIPGYYDNNLAYGNKLILGKLARAFRIEIPEHIEAQIYR